MPSRHLDLIVGELSALAPNVDEAQLTALQDCIVAARRIFVAGAGRSGFAARGFANRLMHLGFTAAFVGEPTTPPIGEGDLLVVGSGSGRTAGLIAMAGKARDHGAQLATITLDPDGDIGRLADVVVVLPGTSRLAGDLGADLSDQPVGSAFEQLSWLVFDAVVLGLREQTGQTNDDLIARHGNLE